MSDPKEAEALLADEESEFVDSRGKTFTLVVKPVREYVPVLGPATMVMDVDGLTNCMGQVKTATDNYVLNHSLVFPQSKGYATNYRFIRAGNMLAAEASNPQFGHGLSMVPMPNGRFWRLAYILNGNPSNFSSSNLKAYDAAKDNRAAMNMAESTRKEMYAGGAMLETRFGKLERGQQELLRGQGELKRGLGEVKSNMDTLMIAPAKARSIWLEAKKKRLLAFKQPCAERNRIQKQIDEAERSMPQAAIIHSSGDNISGPSTPGTPAQGCRPLSSTTSSVISSHRLESCYLPQFVSPSNELTPGRIGTKEPQTFMYVSAPYDYHASNVFSVLDTMALRNMLQDLGYVVSFASGSSEKANQVDILLTFVNSLDENPVVSYDDDSITPLIHKLASSSDVGVVNIFATKMVGNGPVRRGYVCRNARTTVALENPGHVDLILVTEFEDLLDDKTGNTFQVLVQSPLFFIPISHPFQLVMYVKATHYDIPQIRCYAEDMVKAFNTNNHEARGVINNWRLVMNGNFLSCEATNPNLAMHLATIQMPCKRFFRLAYDINNNPAAFKREALLSYDAAKQAQSLRTEMKVDVTLLQGQISSLAMASNGLHQRMSQLEQRVGGNERSLMQIESDRKFWNNVNALRRQLRPFRTLPSDQPHVERDRLQVKLDGLLAQGPPELPVAAEPVPNAPIAAIATLQIGNTPQNGHPVAAKFDNRRVSKRMRLSEALE
ncbi:hypothetical protein BD324DRAFT_609449 [Kockovaella imperatae]|uniref:Uncharacterized protein n=1 Tax=Kockovaella imperatae TaxID=4999 RepID=A0A1Y1UDX1_9TREE|nr:hypothetical protein BD324DRAFT_609449 [Kockovaella imperatae]ORX35737.1 hypothetical protein BD324DRAFT_609449 [Kockovaella imperatae]